VTRSGRSLERSLGVVDLVLLTAGMVIGAGIFIVPAETLRKTDGRADVVLAVWLLGGLLSVLGALSFAELTAMRPDAGGIYAYMRDGFGPLPAFLYGWVLFLAIGPATLAALAVAAVPFFEQLVPLGPVGEKAFALAVVGLVALLNVRGTRESAQAQHLGMLVKGGAIVVLSLGLLWRGSAPIFGDAGVSLALAPRTLGGAGGAMIGVLWAYEGWQWVTFSAGEVKDPQRTFPRGILLGTACLVGLYMLANLAYLRALGPAAAARSERVAADAVTALFGPGAASAIAAVLVVSMVSAAITSVLTCSRVFYAMARDGLFFESLAVVHPRFGTPATAVLAVCALGAAFAVTGTFGALITYVVFVGWIFYGWGGLGVFVLRRRQPDQPRPFRVPGYPLTPALFVAAAAALVANTIATQPEQAAVGLLALISGVPAFYVWRRRAAAAPISA
jgi:APA family basic amino acid/polyamine antiporter